MASNWSALIGQTIEHVVVCHRESTPRSRVHLVFTDGSTFEFFSGSGELIGGSSRLYRGNLAEVLSYIHADTEVKVYTRPAGD